MYIDKFRKYIINDKTRVECVIDEVNKILIECDKKYIDGVQENYDGFLVLVLVVAMKNNEDIDQLFPQIICQYYMLYGHYNKTNRKYPDINVKNTLSLFCTEINIWNKIKKILCTTNESQKWFDTFEHKNKMIEDWDLINKIYYLFSAYNRHKFLKYIGWKIHIPNFIPSKDIIFMVENITDNKKIIKYLLNLVC